MIGNKPPVAPPYKPAPQRRPDLPPIPGTQAGAEGARDHGRTLIVGRGISLSGEINSCDHLFVEGRIEAKIKDCVSLNIAEGGIYKGNAEIGEAEIAGQFEGGISVRGRLVIRSSGVVSGSVQYYELEVEAGGKIIGTVEPLGTPIASLSRTPKPNREMEDGPVVTAIPTPRH